MAVMHCTFWNHSKFDKYSSPGRFHKSINMVQEVNGVIHDNVFDSPKPLYVTNVLHVHNEAAISKCLFHSPYPTKPIYLHSSILDKLDSHFIKSIRNHRLLGSGGFGSVYLSKLGQHRVAIKQLHSFTKNIKARNESFRAEIRLLKLSHPNIVQVLASSKHSPLDSEDAYIIMEFAGERNLLQLINEPSDEFDIDRRMNFSHDIARALEYIHDNCVVHLDIKPANIIVSPKDVCKVADFGCSQIIEKGTGKVSPTMRSYLTGTFAYRAPELLKGQAPCTKADIYAFGVTLWQMLTREQPYTGQNHQVVIFAVVSYGQRPKIPPELMEDLDPVEECYRDLFKQCWESKPDLRPTAQDLVEVLSEWKANLYLDGEEEEDYAL